jgi:DNA repair photolyase
MTAVTLSLPMETGNSPKDLLQLHQSAGATQLVPTNVRWVDRKGPVLHPGPLPGQGDVLSLNVAAGCAHQCAFCSMRASPGYSGDNVVSFFKDTAEQLAAELARRRAQPRAVYVSPSTDPFMPFPDLQEETAQVVEVLARHGIEAWLMTRGYIRPGALRTLVAHRRFVRVTFGLTTLDRNWRKALEPLAAPPRLRLRQIGQLPHLGLDVRVALEPLVPGVTDTRANLTPVLEALAQVGVRHITAGYMFLRAGIADNLARALDPSGYSDLVLAEFEKGPRFSAGAIAPGRYLSKLRRQRGYAALMALAADYDITVSICAATNPDFGSPRRGIDGATRQRLLPLF